MTARQAWKYGFLTKCAAEGLSPAQVHARVKAALARHKRAGIIQDAYNAATDLISKGLVGGTALSVGAGTLGGLALARMHDSELAPEDVRRQELITAMDYYTEQARRSRQLRRLREQGPAVRSWPR